MHALFFVLCLLSFTKAIEIDDDCDPTVDGSCPLPPSSSCGAEKFLSPTYLVDGFHVVCLSLDPSSQDTLLAEVYVDGHNTRKDLRIAATWIQLERELEDEFQLEVPSGIDPANKYKWAMFTSDGVKKITTLEEALEAKIVFIFKGGLFIWPGIAIGHTQTVTHLAGHGSIIMTTISMEPLIFEMKNFLTPDECEHIQKAAEPNMRPSPVTKMDHDQDKPDTQWRTSKTWFMSSQGDSVMINIDKRVEDLTRIPQNHQESVQVLRYEHGQRYSAHHDYFPPQHYQANEPVMRMLDGGRKNRIITVFWYLSEVEAGGETVFPRAGGLPQPSDFNDCTKGLLVKPEPGKVIMFYSMKPNGQFDELSLHGACPVQEGIKWAANKWVWSNPLHP